ncbi:transposable element Tcb1 transposase [Trichonephila clavipes]|nr:transposable element Tcb1 transposase [Trichonephila clavipes]
MRICDRWMQEGTKDRRGRSHPPQCTTSREDRQIVRMTVMDHSVTSRTIAQIIESQINFEEEHSGGWSRGISPFFFYQLLKRIFDSTNFREPSCCTSSIHLRILIPSSGIRTQTLRNCFQRHYPLYRTGGFYCMLY